jgi:hypothetical protein
MELGYTIKKGDSKVVAGAGAAGLQGAQQALK